MGALVGQYVQACTGRPLNYNGLSAECRADYAEAVPDGAGSVEGMAQENCYTYNGLLSPTDREWFTLGTDGDGNSIAADSIRAAG